MNNRQLSRISSPLHALTKGDIRKCVQRWEDANISVMFLFSPYRWARITTNGMPTSVYELFRLVESWGPCHDDDLLDEGDAKAIAKIFLDRVNRGSHSTHDFYSNSSSIFNILAQCGQIAKYLPVYDLPNSILPMLDTLLNLLIRDFKSSVSISQQNTAMDYMNKLRTLVHEKERAANVIASGEYYHGSNGLFFYIDKTPPPTYEQTLSMIDEFLQTIVDAAQKLGKSYALHILFNKMGDTIAPCLVGKSYAILQLANQVLRNRTIVFETEHQLMLAISEELNLLDIQLEMEESKKRILDRYNNLVVGGFTITEAFVDKYLEKYIYLKAPNSTGCHAGAG